MKRLDVNLTDHAHKTLLGLKAQTQLTKTDLIHNAIGLLWLAEQAHERGNTLGEISQDGAGIVSAYAMPIFAGVARREVPPPREVRPVPVGERVRFPSITPPQAPRRNPEPGLAGTVTGENTNGDTPGAQG